MKNKSKKIIKIILIITVVINLFSCKGIDFENKKLAEAKELPLGETMVFVAEEKNKYENKFGKEIWNLKSGNGESYFKDYVVYTVKKFVEKIMKLKLVAVDLNVVIAPEDEVKLDAAFNEYYNMLSYGDLDYMKSSEDNIKKAFHDYHLSRLVVDNLAKNATDEISVSEAKVISVQYMVFTDKDTAYKTREDLNAKGANFSYFAKTRSAEDNIDLIVRRGDENSVNFPQLFYLTRGEITDVLESRNRYYIFRCVSDYLPEETEDRRIEILKSMKNNEFKDNYEKYDVDYYVLSNSTYWRDINLADGNNCKINEFENVYYKYFPKNIE